MKRILVFCVFGLLALPAGAEAHRPWSDGGAADRGCEKAVHGAYYVGVSGRVGCGRARAIARAQIRMGRTFELWNCSGRGSSFGHCHGKGKWRGSTIHWAGY